MTDENCIWTDLMRENGFDPRVPLRKKWVRHFESLRRPTTIF
jgi:hypothetical protein